MREFQELTDSDNVPVKKKPLLIWLLKAYCKENGIDEREIDDNLTYKEARALLEKRFGKFAKKPPIYAKLNRMARASKGTKQVSGGKEVRPTKAPKKLKVMTVEKPPETVKSDAEIIASFPPDQQDMARQILKEAGNEKEYMLSQINKVEEIR